MHALEYFRAYVGVDSGNTEPSGDLAEALAGGYLATTAGGAPYLFGTSFGGVAGVLDVTNPSARAWFAGRLVTAMDSGADGFMTDFGEQVQPDMHFADGATGATEHNRFPVEYQQIVHDTVTRYEATHPGRQIFWYDRAGWQGSAAQESASFPGDETTDFSSASGLQSQTPDMLNRQVGGDWGYTTDIGGYEDATTGATTKELLLRWAEWSVLSPFFRLHGSAGSGTHTRWSYDAETLAAYRSLSELRERVAPLVQSRWASSVQTGLPVVTPLWLAYPDDPRAAAQQQEWLLGPDVLAAPVVEQGATTRTAYLPAGCWTYQPTGRQYSGGQSVTVDAPLTTLAWFTRCGSTPLAAVAPPAAAQPAAGPAAPVRAPASARRTSHPPRYRPRPVATAPTRSLAATGGSPSSAAVAVLATAAALALRRRRHRRPQGRR